MPGHRETIKRLRKERPGLTLREIGEEIGITGQRVHQIMRSMGLPKRRPGKVRRKRATWLEPSEGELESVLPDTEEARRARQEVANAVYRGVLDRADSMRCVACLEWAAHYHHFAGYEPDNWFTVVPLCVSCHFKAHMEQWPERFVMALIVGRMIEIKEGEAQNIGPRGFRNKWKDCQVGRTHRK